MGPLRTQGPKPTLPVLDETLLLHWTRVLSRTAVDGVIINTCHNRGALQAAAEGSPLPVEFSCEPELRGSGGGILHARHLLEGHGPFLVINCDTWMELNLGALLAAHARGKASVTLALRDDPRKERFGTIGYQNDGSVRRITKLVDRGDETGSGLFTGIQVMDDTIFEEMPQQLAFDTVRDLYVPWIEAGRTIQSWPQPHAMSWWPVGCPEELLEANLRALARAVRSKTDVLVAESARVEGTVHAPAWIGCDAHVLPGAEIGPWVIVSQGARVARASRLEQTLALPGSACPAETQLQRGILYAQQVWRDA